MTMTTMITSDKQILRLLILLKIHIMDLLQTPKMLTLAQLILKILIDKMSKLLRIHITEKYNFQEKFSVFFTFIQYLGNGKQCL